MLLTHTITFDMFILGICLLHIVGGVIFMNSVFYIVVGILLFVSVIKDRKKTKKALMIAYKSLLSNIKMMIGMMVFMGVVFSIIDTKIIIDVFGRESGILGIVAGILIGAVSFIPSFIAFPLGKTLLENGAGYPQIAGFVSSLMGVGIISLPMEIEYFGKKAAILRNIFAFAASVIFAILVGVIL